MFFEGVASAINRYPTQIAIVLAVLFLLSIWGMTGVTMETGSDTYLDKSTREGVIYDTYSERFLSDTTVLLVYCDDPLDPATLKYLDQLETEVLRLQNVGSAQSLADLFKAMNGGSLPASKAEARMLFDRLSEEQKEELLPSNSITLVLIGVEQGVSQDASRKVLAEIQAVIESDSPPPDITVQLTGNTAFDQQMEDELSGSLVVLIFAAMVLMVITLAFLFGSMSHRFIPALLVAVGMVYTFGVMGLFNISMDIGVVAAFPVLLGLGIDYAIQFQARFDEERRRLDPAAAVFTTVTNTGPAVMMALFATSMGFLAMYISPVPMVRSFATVSLIGVFSCYIASLLGFPVLARLLNYEPKPHEEGGMMAVKARYDNFLARTAVRIAKNPVPVILIAAFVAFAGITLDSSIPIDTSEDTFVPPNMPTKLSLNTVTDLVGSVRPLPLYVEGDGVDDLATIQWMDRFGAYALEQHTELTGVTSPATMIREYNNGVLPDTQAGIDAALSLVPAETKDLYLDGHTAAVIAFTTIDMDMGLQNEVKEEVVADLNWVQPPPGITAEPTGDYDMYTSLIANIAMSKEQMTYLGFALIFAFLVLMYRRLYAVSPLIPLVSVVGWNVVGMALIGINYTPMTACLGSMTIGVAAEYTILMMERYSEEFERTGDHFMAVRDGVQKVGTAITVSGLVTACGFSAMILSDFQIISNFGVTTVIAVGFSLIGAIVIMPAALSVVRIGRSGRAEEGEASVGQTV